MIPTRPGSSSASRNTDRKRKGKIIVHLAVATTMLTSMTRKMIIPLVRGGAVIPVMIAVLPVHLAHVGVAVMKVHRQTGLLQGAN